MVLDVLLDRAPWVEDATALLDAIAKGQARAVAATAVSDLLQLLSVVPLASAAFQRALGLGLRDYEDGVQTAAALQIGADCLVTRNAKDFNGAPVTVRSPGEILALLGPQ